MSGRVPAAVVDAFSADCGVAAVADGCFDRKQSSLVVSRVESSALQADIVSADQVLAWLSRRADGVPHPSGSAAGRSRLWDDAAVRHDDLQVAGLQGCGRQFGGALQLPGWCVPSTCGVVRLGGWGRRRARLEKPITGTPTSLKAFVAACVFSTKMRREVSVAHPASAGGVAISRQGTGRRGGSRRASAFDDDWLGRTRRPDPGRFRTA
jgi:hypothetical protein